jgi:hypothetical protein
MRGDASETTAIEIAESLTATGRELIMALSGEWKSLPLEWQLRINGLPSGLVVTGL